MSNTVSVNVVPGFKGTVTGLCITAGYYQKTTVKVSNSTGQIGTTVFRGQGANAAMKQDIDGQQAYVFGPYTTAATITITIENSPTGQNGPFKASKVTQPITVTKNPDTHNPYTYVISNVLSEDSTDNDYSDTIINVFQWK